MRYRLRTLVIATAIGPPALAGVWFFHGFIAPIVAVLIATFAVGLCVAVACDRGNSS